jgi:hypothetical protein
LGGLVVMGEWESFCDGFWDFRQRAWRIRKKTQFLDVIEIYPLNPL